MSLLVGNYCPGGEIRPEGGCWVLPGRSSSARTAQRYGSAKTLQSTWTLNAPSSGRTGDIRCTDNLGEHQLGV